MSRQPSSRISPFRVHSRRYLRICGVCNVHAVFDLPHHYQLRLLSESCISAASMQASYAPVQWSPSCLYMCSQSIRPATTLASRVRGGGLDCSSRSLGRARRYASTCSRIESSYRCYHCQCKQLTLLSGCPSPSTSVAMHTDSYHVRKHAWDITILHSKGI